MDSKQALRSIRPERLGEPEPGFAGAGHTAVELISPRRLPETDPFVLLMDDRLDMRPGTPIGGAHPHAGLETVTFVLSGSVRDRDEGTLYPGDAVWMTAGRGVIHNEEVHAGEPARILQLWLTLPERERAAAPRFDVLRVDTLPVFRDEGVEARLYSGHTHGLTSGTRNHVPVTLIDLRLTGGAVFSQTLPASYNGFLLPIEGRERSLRVGEVALGPGEIGWLDRREGHDDTTLRIAGEGRALLYAGQRQNEPTVQHGPFVAGSPQAIERMFREYRAGRFTPISQLAR